MFSGSTRMPPLANPRHERFAQELAKGETADAAYQSAGYKANRGNASTLKRDQSISDRVAELLAEREAIHGQATAQAIAHTGLSKQWVLDRLVENANRAMQAEEVKDTHGKGTGEYRYEGSVANRALELLGKEMGMFVDRREDVTPRRTLDQIDARIRSLRELARGSEDRAGDTAGGAGRGAGADEALPTVPGHGTA